MSNLVVYKQQAISVTADKKVLGQTFDFLSINMPEGTPAWFLMQSARALFLDPTNAAKRVTCKMLLAQADCEEHLPESSPRIRAAHYIALAVLAYARKSDRNVQFWASKARKELQSKLAAPQGQKSHKAFAK